MKIRDIKQKLKTEEYQIPDVLSKIKANLPTVKPRYEQQRQAPLLKRAVLFASLIFVFFIVFTSLASPTTYAELEGPMNLNYFSSDEAISRHIKRNNQQRDNYIFLAQNTIDGYHLDEIKVNKIYDFDNNTALAYNNKIFYLSDEGLVVYNTADNKLTAVYTDVLDFDEKTNVKTIYLADKDLIVVYNNKNYTNVVKYNVDTYNKLYTYSIGATFVSSHLYKNKLYLVTILNQPIYPFIKEYNYKKIISPQDIGYLENVLGNSYTIVTTIDLTHSESHEQIFLSFDKWDVVYFKDDHLYLINNHINYKKNLDYGEYTTIIRFEDTEFEGMEYFGSYTIKGSLQEKNHIFEENGNLRVALEVTNYQIRRTFLFFKKMKAVEYYVNVINLQATEVDGVNSLKQTSNYIIEEDNELDKAIFISGIKFLQDKLVIETTGFERNTAILDFSDSTNIIRGHSQNQRPNYSNLTNLNRDYGFAIRTIKMATGDFEIKFYDLTSPTPDELPEYLINLNYSDLLDGANYIVIEAIKNKNSLYLGENAENINFGFSVQNNLKEKGVFTIVNINKETHESTVINLESEEFIIDKVISLNNNELYALANKHVIKYSLESDNFLEQLDILGIE